MSSKSGRVERKRQDARLRIMAVSRDLFAELGFEAVPISLIAEKADIGFGSFYTHFASKQELQQAVIEQSALEWAEQIAAAMGAISDPAAVVSISIRQSALRLAADPAWSGFLMNASFTGLAVWQPMIDFLSEAITRGVTLGRFDVPSRDAMLTAIIGTISMMNHRLLTSETDAGASGEDMVELILRMLGLPPDEARALAHAPLEALGGTTQK